jgi:hypothetical protein
MPFPVNLAERGKAAPVTALGLVELAATHSDLPQQVERVRGVGVRRAVGPVLPCRLEHHATNCTGSIRL